MVTTSSHVQSNDQEVIKNGTDKKNNTKIHFTLKEILNTIGEFGRFQKILLFIVCVLMLPFAYPIYKSYFTMFIPKWKCVTNSTLCTFNGTFSRDDERRCAIPRNQWEYVENHEYSMVIKHDLYCKGEYFIYIATCLFFLGMLFGSIVLGYVADICGRKKVIVPSGVTMILVGFVSTYSSNIYLYLLFRFILGIAFVGHTTFMFVLLSEVVGDGQRAAVAITPFVSSSVASSLLAGNTYHISNWKLVGILCTVPYMILLPLFYFVPESMTWLHSKNKHGHLKKTLKQIAQYNKKALDDDFHIKPYQSTQKSQKSVNPFDVFKDSKTLITTMIFGYSWIAIAMAFYSINLATIDFGGTRYLSCIAEIPSSIFGIFLINHFGRKKTTMFTAAVSSIALIAIAFTSRENSTFVSITVGVIGKAGATMAYNTMYIWSAETYPTTSRSLCLGILHLCSKIGAALAPWLTHRLMAVHNGLSFIVMAAALLLAVFSLCFTKETHGNTMFNHDDKKTDPEN